MRYDYITNGKQVEIVEAAVIDDVVHPLSSIRLMSDEERSALGILDHVVPLAEAKAERLAALANERWRRTQTFSYDGETDVPADPALSVITSLAVADQMAQAAPGYDADALRTFKLKSPAVFRQWTIGQIVAYGLAIGVHVQACFDREKVLAVEIQAAEDRTTLDEIDIAADWP